MKKRGVKAQTTIFIIIAIAIVAIVGIFFFIKSSSEEQNRGREYFLQQGLQPSLNNIQDFIVECHEETSQQALVRIGVQGGYHNKPNYYFDMEWAFIPYYYYQGRILNPTKQKIQEELSLSVNENLESCLDEIQFPAFNLRYSKSSTLSSIRPEKVDFTTSLSVIIEHEGNTINFQLSEHPLTINSKLNEILEVSDFITNSHEQDPDLMCINCIVELAKERDLYVDFIAFQEDTTLVMILENSTMEEPYIFEFMNRYNIGG